MVWQKLICDFSQLIQVLFDSQILITISKSNCNNLLQNNYWYQQNKILPSIQIFAFGYAVLNTVRRTASINWVSINKLNFDKSCFHILDLFLLNLLSFQKAFCLIYNNRYATSVCILCNKQLFVTTYLLQFSFQSFTEYNITQQIRNKMMVKIKSNIHWLNQGWIYTSTLPKWKGGICWWWYMSFIFC